MIKIPRSAGRAEALVVYLKAAHSDPLDDGPAHRKP